MTRLADLVATRRWLPGAAWAALEGSLAGGGPCAPQGHAKDLQTWIALSEAHRIGAQSAWGRHGWQGRGRACGADAWGLGPLLASAAATAAAAAAAKLTDSWWLGMLEQDCSDVSGSASDSDKGVTSWQRSSSSDPKWLSRKADAEEGETASTESETSVKLTAFQSESYNSSAAKGSSTSLESSVSNAKCCGSRSDEHGRCGTCTPADLRVGRLRMLGATGRETGQGPAAAAVVCWRGCLPTRRCRLARRRMRLLTRVIRTAAKMVVQRAARSIRR